MIHCFSILFLHFSSCSSFPTNSIPFCYFGYFLFYSPSDNFSMPIYFPLFFFPFLFSFSSFPNLHLQCLFLLVLYLSSFLSYSYLFIFFVHLFLLIFAFSLSSIVSCSGSAHSFLYSISTSLISLLPSVSSSCPLASLSQFSYLLLFFLPSPLPILSFYPRNITSFIALHILQM